MARSHVIFIIKFREKNSGPKLVFRAQREILLPLPPPWPVIPIPHLRERDLVFIFYIPHATSFMHLTAVRAARNYVLIYYPFRPWPVIPIPHLRERDLVFIFSPPRAASGIQVTCSRSEGPCIHLLTPGAASGIQVTCSRSEGPFINI
jgi:hypothetical protein